MKRIQFNLSSTPAYGVELFILANIYF